MSILIAYLIIGLVQALGVFIDTRVRLSEYEPGAVFMAFMIYAATWPYCMVKDAGYAQQPTNGADKGGG